MEDSSNEIKIKFKPSKKRQTRKRASSDEEEEEEEFNKEEYEKTKELQKLRWDRNEKNDNLWPFLVSTKKNKKTIMIGNNNFYTWLNNALTNVLLFCRKRAAGTNVLSLVSGKKISKVMRVLKKE